jgi:hypothetical protein
MDEKYYFPDIYDIRIGFKCELFNAKAIFGVDVKFIKGTVTSDGWVIYTIDEDDSGSDHEDDSVLDNIIGACAKNHVRVPFLTQEQMEGEGWMLGDILRDGRLRMIKGTYKLTCNTRISYPSGPHIMVYDEENIKFDGECRCINDFRFLMKRLKITE